MVYKIITSGKRIAQPQRVRIKRLWKALKTSWPIQPKITPPYPKGSFYKNPPSITPMGNLFSNTLYYSSAILIIVYRALITLAYHIQLLFINCALFTVILYVISSICLLTLISIGGGAVDISSLCTLRHA
jgi:hypothetical protein